MKKNMVKYDLESVVAKNKKLYNKDPDKADKIGLGSNLKSLETAPCVVMDEWWQKATNTKGLPFGQIVQIAGDSDSGKTSMAIAAMKAAIKQGIAVLYVETENKTTKEDLESWGVDTSQVMLVKSSVAEEAATLMFGLWDEFYKNYPDGQLLGIVDSWGNTVSRRDKDLDLTEGNQKPGGKGQTNRVWLNRLIAKMQDNQAAILILNYTYDNIGSPGKTNAGGKALNFFSSLTYQTTRKSWIEQTVKGVKRRIGAKVTWKLFKNHISKSNPGPKAVDLDITAEGIKLAATSEE